MTLERINSLEDDETNRLLVEVNEEELGITEESQPRPSLGSSDTVQAPVLEAINGTKGMAPLNSSGGEMRRGEDLCQGSSPNLSNTLLFFISFPHPVEGIKLKAARCAKKKQ